VTWQRWEVEWTGRAERELARCSRQDVQRLVDTIIDFAATGRGDVRQLEGHPGEWRIRVGDVRAIFVFDRAGRRLIVTRVAPRGRAYR
jgi:mRNA-degrading endonuclease RelE of RelBE toxin-antitoxin system